MTTCDNCGTPEGHQGIKMVKVAHLPTYNVLRETNDACAPCARAMVRSMPTVWAIVPERKN